MCGQFVPKTRTRKLRALASTSSPAVYCAPVNTHTPLIVQQAPLFELVVCFELEVKASLPLAQVVRYQI